MSSFHPLDNGDFSITFTSQEAHVLINLTEQLLELLADGDGQSHQVDPLLHLVGISKFGSSTGGSSIEKGCYLTHTRMSRPRGSFAAIQSMGLRGKEKSPCDIDL